jgi:hypothetical protein
MCALLATSQWAALGVSGPHTTGVNNLELIAFVFKIENVH